MTRHPFSLIRFVLPVMIIMSASCKKDDNKATSIHDKMLGDWQLTSVMYTPAVYDFNGDGIKDADGLKYEPACRRDDYVTFLNTGFYEANEGPTKCNPGDDQVTLLTWYLSADEKTLIADDEEYTILEVSDSQLKISYSDVEGGIAYTGISVFRRK